MEINPKFSKYLYDNELFDDLFYIVEILKNNPQIPVDDSVWYFIGIGYYKKSNYENSFKCLTKISFTHNLYKSSFLINLSNTLNFANKKFPDEPKESFIVLEPEFSEYFEQYKCMKFLLARDFKAYHQFSKCYLDDIYNELQVHKHKSPLLAGILSALIPGLGKVYTGNYGQGLSTFLFSTLIGLQAWEGYHKTGLNNPGFYTYSTLFTIFYIGNIWGSGINARVKEKEFNEQIDKKILLHNTLPSGIFP